MKITCSNGSVLDDTLNHKMAMTGTLGLDPGVGLSPGIGLPFPCALCN